MVGITDKDVSDYLAAARDDESIGFCCSSDSCLLAMVVKQKYPNAKDVFVNEQIEFELDDVAYVLPLSEMQHKMVDVFDLSAIEVYDPITKAEFLAAWEGIAC